MEVSCIYRKAIPVGSGKIAEKKEEDIVRRRIIHV